MRSTPFIGNDGLNEDQTMIRQEFHKFSKDKIEPFAHDWHLKDELIPLKVIEELANLGVFGLTIPEEFGGTGLDKITMCVVSEELSRGYIGVGSLATRTDIASELILCGGTSEQKSIGYQKYLLVKLCLQQFSQNQTQDQTLETCRLVQHCVEMNMVLQEIKHG